MITTRKDRRSVRIWSCLALLVNEMTKDHFWGPQGLKEIAYCLEPDRTGRESGLYPFLIVWTMFKCKYLSALSSVK